MARIPEAIEIEESLSDDPARHNVSGFTNTHYFYNFPYDLGSGKERDYGIYDLYSNQVGAPFLTINSHQLLSKEESYFKLSVSLALFSLFEKEGFSPRPVGGIGGYNNGVTDDIYAEVEHSAIVQEYIDDLNAATSPYQIQSRFTLSRAHSIMRDPESAIIEFFKIIELFIKQNAYQGDMSESAYSDVFNKFPKVFSENVRSSLKAGLLNAETVNVIWKLKDIRNRFVGHGGIRPMVADIFGDPEDNAKAINYSDFVYDTNADFGEHFFEKIMYDIEVLAVILFCKLNAVEAVYASIPGCWWEPSSVIKDIMKAEGVKVISIFPSELEKTS